MSEVTIMSTKRSRLFYRNPEAIQELKARLQAKGDRKPVEQSPDEVRAKVKQLEARIAVNRAAKA